MGWSETFGEFWFWIFAAAVWSRSAFSVYGAPRRLVVEARREPAAAGFLHGQVRYRLATAWSLSDAPWPPLVLGVGLAFGAAAAFAGDFRLLGALAAVAPPAIVERLLIGRVRTAAEAAHVDAPERDAALAAFADLIDQIWRARVGATAATVMLTLAIGAVAQSL